MSSAPTGTITIVFTDIQGSTALWERLGEEFEPVLKLHHDTVRTQLTANGGYEVKTEGDAFMVAFSEPAAAIRFCLNAQLALNNAPWPDAFIEDSSPIAATRSTPDGIHRGVRVRMGVHTGRPTATPDPKTGRIDYVGRMVNKAARIARAGHGGQILVSNRAWEDAQATLGTMPLVDRDLGEHSLRDIPGRERLREVLHPALAQRRFPPIKTLQIRQTNLTAMTDRFVGRVDELSALEEHLQSGARLLTLIGPPGVGKRRLALEFGRRNLDGFGGSVWAVDLGEAQDLGQVCAAMAATLDMALSQPDPVAQIGNALLGRGPTLIFLLDLHTASPQITDSIGAWLNRAPDTRMVTTTTEPLPNPDAQLIPLDPLSSDTASSLLEARLGNHAPIPDAWVQAAQGLPLALELLAPTLARGAGAGAEKLPPSAPPQPGQPTAVALSRVLDTAISALSPDEAKALQRLSMFCGGFPAGAATVAGAQAALPVLIQRNLIRAAGQDRWTLAPAIAEYAGVHLASDRAQLLAAEAAHGAWAAQLAREAVRKRDWRKLAQERDNLLQANVRATDRGDAETAGSTGIGLMTALHWLGPPAAAIPVAIRTLRLPGLSPRMQANLLRLHAFSQHFMGHTEDAKSSLQEAETLARTIDDPSVAAEVYLERGRQQDAQGLVELAMDAFQSSLDAFHASADPTGEAQAIAAMGNLAAKRGETDYARRLYLAALAQHRRVGDSQAEGAALSNLAILTTIEGRPAEARELFRDALAIHRSRGDRRGEAVTQGNLGDLYLQTRDLDSALTHLNRALQTAREIGDRHIEGCFLGSLGETKAREGHLPQARSQMARAERLLREEGDSYELIKLICRRGQVEILGRYPDRALKCLKQARALVQTLSISQDTKPHQAIVELQQQLKERGLIDEDTPANE